jgi:hypothetical protein
VLPTDKLGREFSLGLSFLGCTITKSVASLLHAMMELLLGILPEGLTLSLLSCGGLTLSLLMHVSHLQSYTS